MNKGSKHTFVGQFFEEVGHLMLGGELSRNEDADVTLWRTVTCVEVKASGYQSSYGFRLSVEQIEKYEKTNPFPFGRSWYMLFAYRNCRQRAKDGKRFTELSVHEFPPEINTYLAKSVLWCTIVDLSIVSRWKEVLPHSTKSVMGHRGLRTVDLKPKDVHNFTNGGFTTGLRGLDLDPAKFHKISGQIKSTVQSDLFSEHKISFPVTAILPTNESSSFQRMLKRRGYYFYRVAS